ncbi:MAG: hypothetical protein KGZ30_00905 [Anaplasmataceae bacterium]|nr:hypothetical protein [Anaplasmataceae bacterium]
MTKNIIIAVILGLLLAFGAYYFDQSPPKITQTAPEEEIRALVTEFGTKLKDVNLLAPKDEVLKAIKENYGSYVSEGLLEGWEMDPERAPGRLTSSPWPDRIEVLSIEVTEDDAYDVQGLVIEVTSTEVGTSTSSQPAAQYPVGMIVRNQDGRWVITGFTKAL